MGQDAAWTIMNTGVQPIIAVLAVELWAFQHSRALELLLDGRHVHNILVDRTRQLYHVGPLTVPPGEHALMFHSSNAPIQDEEDITKSGRRSVSVAVGNWRWNVQDDQP